MVTVRGAPPYETHKIRRLTHSGSLLVRTVQGYSRVTGAWHRQCANMQDRTRAVQGIVCFISTTHRLSSLTPTVRRPHVFLTFSRDNLER